MLKLFVLITIGGFCIDAMSVSFPRASNRIDVEETSEKSDKPVNPFTNPALQANLLTFVTKYRKLREKKSPVEMRAITTVGLVQGALSAKDLMKSNLDKIANDLIAEFNVSTPKQNMQKLIYLEETMEHDRASIEVFNNMMQLVRDAKSFDEFKKEMQRIAEVVSIDWHLTENLAIESIVFSVFFRHFFVT